MPRLGVNDVLLASDHPLQSILQIRRGDGYAQYGGFPFVMRSTHHISRDEHKARKNSSWPESTESTLVSTAETNKPTLFATVATVAPERSPILETTKPAKLTDAPPSTESDALGELWNMQLGKRPPRPPHDSLF